MGEVACLHRWWNWINLIQVNILWILVMMTIPPNRNVRHTNRIGPNVLFNEHWKAKKFLKKKLFKYSETAGHVLKGNKVLRKNNEKDESLHKMYEEKVTTVVTIYPTGKAQTIRHLNQDQILFIFECCKDPGSIWLQLYKGRYRVNAKYHLKGHQALKALLKCF